MLKNFILISIVLISGCLENDGILYQTDDFKNEYHILKEIEKRGDYINSSSTSLFSCFLSADSLYKSQNSFTILDIRSPEKYNKGHIDGAVNLNQNELYDYLTTKSHFDNYVLVSSSGQAAAYYTYLMRIYGMQNVYSLLFGMASWNEEFSKDIIQYFTSFGYGGEITLRLPEKFYDLPDIIYEGNSSSSELLNERIKQLASMNFQEDFVSQNDPYLVTETTLSSTEIINNYENYFIACYATNDIYTDPKGKMTHPSGAVLYYPFAPIADLRSTKFLQTFPPDKTIAVYSYSGHLSAMVAAHLRLLGYDARSVLYGVHNGAYNYASNLISSGKYYAFNGSKSYPFVTE